MGMRGLGQIAALCAIARPDVVVVPHIGPEHLELLGTVERVAEANAEAIAALPAGGTAVVPARADALEPFLTRDDVSFRRFAPDEVDRRDGVTTASASANARSSSTLPFTQRHLALNTLAALHAYDALGLPLDRAHEGVSGIRLSPWRGEELALPGGGFVVNDAYNANPDSMRAALEHLAERAGARRKLAILGEMAELGASGRDVPPRDRRARRRARDRGRSAWASPLARTSPSPGLRRLGRGTRARARAPSSRATPCS